MTQSMMTQDPRPPGHSGMRHGRGLFDTYTISERAYDEAFTATGQRRPHWDAVVPFLEALGSQGLARSWEQARRMIHDNGVTFNVYGDPQGMDRLWELDAIPWVIPEAEWQHLKAALEQRARLLNAILADVYGSQALLEHGVLPPELVFAHPGFLRPCHGLPVPNNCYLHVYAVDLGRGPDGRWWVLADRAQSPAGAGYALENRLILSSVLSDLFRDCQVQRFAPFFIALRQTLMALAPRHRDNPRIVLLTPGAYDESYFEHAYLARYLGYTLVEGADLTVRDQTVFLKTLAGLQPVDVILRRLDDAFCDPLELDQESIRGTAGLLQAVRAGNVVVANALGSGWLENPALMPLLPALCRHMLGEELALPSVQTWWCGNDADRDYVLDHMEDLILAPCMPVNPHEVVFGARLSPAEREQLRQKIRARPYAYTAQARITLSWLPAWDGEDVQPQRTVLRAYVVATGDGYTVMPGGLARVTSANEQPFVSMQGDDRSKDTWVLSTSPTEMISLLPSSDQPLALRRSGYDFPSRAADNLFWMGRYAERAEGLVRFLRAVMLRLAGEAKPGGIEALPALLKALAATWEGLGIATPAPDMAVNGSNDMYEDMVLAAMCDIHSPNSVRASLQSLRRGLALVRDYMTLEAWHIVSQLEENFKRFSTSGQLHVGETLALLHQTIMTLSAFNGLGSENMIRGPEWRFLDMGRRIERATHSTHLLRSALVEIEGPELAVLEALLEIGDSSITYRTRYLTRLQCGAVLDLLIADDTNPRAILYQLNALADHVENLPRDQSKPELSPAQRLAIAMRTNVRLAEMEPLAQIARNGKRLQLDKFLFQLSQDLPALSDTITHHYLSHAESTRHLSRQAGNTKATPR
ncbi:MAG: hypothetical protein ETSY1_10870 [Candidatus Entotheonella factor]|uniref:Uncharacterized protein n=2 Tax=Candidatus Entotheonella TaxID=93171 RepID=W4LRD2_ENTF1|nr:MAG: hypothetical protein ETSY1_10870 [Candidatus Entotheonella factor]